MPDWSLEWDRDTGVYNLDRSRVTYRVPLEFITRVNGSYNDGGTTYKFNMPARLGSQRGLIHLLAPD